MENNIEKIARKRKERDLLFAALERKLNRILATTEAKGIIGQSATPSPQTIDEGLAILGARCATSTTNELADMAVHGRQGGGKNSRRRRMGN